MLFSIERGILRIVLYAKILFGGLSMKKRFLSIIFAVILICTLFAGCKDKEEETIETHTVKLFTPLYLFSSLSIFDRYEHAFGDYYVITKEINDGEVIGSITLQNIKEDSYRFCGWFSDKEHIYQWNPVKDEVRCDLILYSKWEKIT